MAALTPFRQSGPTVLINASTSVNSSVQALSADAVGNQQYVLTNSGTTLAFVAIGANAQQAIQNAVVPTLNPTGSPTCYPLLNGSQITITGPQNAYFAAITLTGTDQIWVTPGYGQ